MYVDTLNRFTRCPMDSAKAHGVTFEKVKASLAKLKEKNPQNSYKMEEI
ncbi:MAG: hypothetical protein ACRCYT_01985 [Cetobacterium sp.]